MSVKINSLQMENVKKVSAVAFEPGENGLTVIGGTNGAGKTSVLDAICFALGGEKYRPTNLQKEGAYAQAYIKLTLSNGLIVERVGKNASLKVVDPAGQKAGQKLLDSFVEQFALDLPKFMNSNSKEKAGSLLKTLGIGETLAALDNEETKIFNERHAMGQIADRKKKYASELSHYPDAPEEPVSATEMIQQQQAIILKNAENQKKREQVGMLSSRSGMLAEEVKQISLHIEELKKRLDQKNNELQTTINDLQIAKQSAESLQDESTAEIERSLDGIDATNSKVRANLDKAKAIADADAAQAEYDELTGKIDGVRKKRLEMLDGVSMPLPGLSVEQGELILDGKAWDCMSSAQQLKASAAIIKAIRPECGFILMDKLEQMDTGTLKDFGEWAETEGLQIIATRVSTGDECQIIIEDGKAISGGAEIKTFSAGEF